MAAEINKKIKLETNKTKDWSLFWISVRSNLLRQSDPEKKKAQINSLENI